MEVGQLAPEVKSIKNYLSNVERFGVHAEKVTLEKEDTQMVVH